MLRRLHHEVRTLFSEEEPLVQTSEPRWRRFFRFWVRVGQAYMRNRCLGWASALAYSSLLAFIPLLAVAISISTSILKNNQEQIREWINKLLDNVVPQLRNTVEFANTKEQVLNYVLETIGNVHSGTLGATGVIALLVMILFLIARIEETLNDIWGVKEGRTWYMRMVNYWAAISLGPIVIIAAFSFSTSLHLENTGSWLRNLPIVGWLLVKLIPLPLLVGACTLFYAFMPKAKVQWRAALVGGLVAGVLWLLNNELSVYSVTQISRGGNGGMGGINQNRAIYGSLVAVPIFMVGLYFFWALLLFGAQVSYTFQHRRSFLMARQAERVHQAGREFVALRIMIEAGRAFCTGAPPPTVDSLAERLEVPGQLITRATSTLLQTRLLVELNDDEEDPGLMPGRPLEKIRVADIIDAMRRGVGDQLPTKADPSRAIAQEELARMAAAEQMAGARTLAELVEPVLDPEPGTGSSGMKEEAWISRKDA